MNSFNFNIKLQRKLGELLGIIKEKWIKEKIVNLIKKH